MLVFDTVRLSPLCRRLTAATLLGLSFAARADETEADVAFGPPEARTRATWRREGAQIVFNVVAEGWAGAAAVAARDEGVKSEYCLVQAQAEPGAVDGNALCLLLDANRDGESFWALFVDASGRVDGLRVNALDWQAPWPTTARCRATTSGGRLTAEIVLPLADLGYEPGPGDRWRLGLGRRHLGGGRPATVFSGPESFAFRYGSPARRRGWSALPLPAHALTAAPPAVLDGLVVADVSPGACDPATPEENVVVAAVRNDGAADATVELHLASDAGIELGRVVKRCPAGQTTPLAAVYAPPSGAGQLVCTLRVGDRVLYASRHPVLVRLPPRVPPVVGDFRPERFERFSPRVAGYRGICWSQLEQPRRGADFARRHGWAWTDGDWFKLCASEHLMPWMVVDRTEQAYNDVATHIASIRRHGAKMAMRPQSWENRRDYWTRLGLYGGYMADPGDRRTYFQSLRSGLERYGDDTAALFVDDELYLQLRRRTVDLYARHAEKGDYPYILEIDREVRERFGAGKHGVPRSPKDPDPLRWIALKRWVNAFADEFEKEAVRTIRALRPELPILSPDLVGDMISSDATRWRDGRFDVVMTQLNNHLRPNAANGVAQCRILHDLARPAELWGCTHLEDSGFPCTPREMHALYTHYVRNGLTGLHAWPLGGEKPWMKDTRISRPDGWDFFLRTAAFLAEGRRAKLPEHTAAGIYVSELSQMSLPGHWDWVGFVEPAFLLLQMQLGADVSFLSDLGVERGVFDPSSHRLVVVPFLPFVGERSGAALLDAAERGTTLVVTDPQAFGRLSDGSVPEALRKRFLGGTRVEPTAEPMTSAVSEPVDFLADRPPFALAVPPPTLLGLLGRSHRLLPGPDARALFRYPDGSAAAIVRPIGKGRIVLFGFNPYGQTSNQPETWTDAPAANLDCLRALLKASGASFAEGGAAAVLPAPVAPAASTDVCLSANGLRLRRGLPQTAANASVGLRYRYDVSPDLRRDVAAEGWIAAGDGLLTDRIAATLQPAAKACTVAWTRPGPVDVTVDLNGEREVALATLYTAGRNPSVKLLGSRDGETFAPLGDLPGDASAPQVAERRFMDIPGAWRMLRFRIEDAHPLELVEMEVWERGAPAPSHGARTESRMEERP